MIIGLCGKSGSGKTTVAKEIVKRMNGIHLDIDTVGHKVLEIKEVQEKLIESFGPNVIKDSKVDRKALGNLVFDNRHKMKKLSDITWKFMEKYIDRIIEENKDKAIILDWILLTNTKFFKLCDITILLDIPYEIRKKRAMKRDNITDEAFDLREKASIDYNENDFTYVLKSTEEENVRKLVNNL